LETDCSATGSWIIGVETSLEAAPRACGCCRFSEFVESAISAILLANVPAPLRRDLLHDLTRQAAKDSRRLNSILALNLHARGQLDALD